MLNKQTRLIVSLLFFGMIVLAVAITRFYSRAEKSPTSTESKNPSIIPIAGSDDNGNQTFQLSNNKNSDDKNSNGLVGIIDSNEHILVPAEWQTIKFTRNKDRCIASKNIGGKIMTGCIDYEGNIVVPFIYSDISENSCPERVLYFAKTQNSGKEKTFVYDINFNPCFYEAWDKCDLNHDNSELELELGNDKYTYFVKNSSFIFKEAELHGSCLGKSYTTKIDAPGLTFSMMEKISSTIGKYVEYAFSNEAEGRKLLSDIDRAPENSFRRLFHDEKIITDRTLISIYNVVVESKDSDDGIPHYTASFTAKSEIMFMDSEDEPNKLTDAYTAAVEFAGSSAKDLKAVSGKFTEEKPDYSKAEIKKRTEDQPDEVPQEN